MEYRDLASKIEKHEKEIKNLWRLVCMLIGSVIIILLTK